jgi:hypothetical protein
VTAYAYFLPKKRRIKDTIISSENAPKLTCSNLSAKKFSGDEPQGPQKGEVKGGREEWGGVGSKGDGESEMFTPIFVGHAPPMLVGLLFHVQPVKY